ncbi:type II toxin-antitoxin system VapC family toxin [Fibrisoma montanum]|uniref:Ribonuclease VapC n=1 Tax=Fibrisoma montanum TaxID=2305895 RepID=A0A418MK40_9BACT|nr:type II toxin-antitoxin system VapC family toxin [Fibrisoma montanum]RIV27691.1 type II toxin-antitoxin system VapC family toxin [Fibrisoma montanum]
MVVDTSVFIEHIRAKDKASTSLTSIASVQDKYVSSATIYELYCGATSAGKAAELAVLLSDFVELSFDRLVAIKAAELFINLKRRNQLVGPLDILIAATALVHNLPVKTLNISHFGRVDGLIIL